MFHHKENFLARKGIFDVQGLRAVAGPNTNLTVSRSRPTLLRGRHQQRRGPREAGPRLPGEEGEMLSVPEEDAATTPKPCPVPGVRRAHHLADTLYWSPPRPPKPGDVCRGREEVFYPDLAFAENGAHSVPLRTQNPNQ